jgi:nucleoside-diphosphate-sugar epimerase
VGQKVLPMHLPARFLRLAAKLDRAVRGPDAKLTADRVGYLCHPDWTARADRRPPPDLWKPTVPLTQGLADTAAWYRAQRLL